MFFWKNFNFSKTFLLDLSEIRGEIPEISALFLGFLNTFFFSNLPCKFLYVNEIKIQATWPKPMIAEIFFLVFS